MKKGVRGFVFLGIVSLILICGYVSAATPQAIDLTFAKCGSADGKLSMIKPTGVAACEKGTSSTVTESSDKQSWIWSCSAENLGTLYASPCSSYKKIAEVIWISEDDDGGCDNSNYWNMWTGTFNSKSGGCGWLAHNTIPGQPTNSGCWVNAKEQDGGIFGGDDCGYGIANINYIFDGTTLDNSYKKFEYQSKYGGNDNDANCLLDGWSWAISGGKNSYICKNDGYWYTCDSDTFGKQIESNGKTFKCDKEARISYTNSYILNPRPDLNTNNAEATIEMEQCDASHIGSIAATYPDEYTVVFYECIQQLSNTPFDFYIWQPIESDCKGIAGQISCCSELQNIDKNLNENYILTNNIDCSDTKNWNHGAGFDPIGENGKPFTGSFDGKGYKISNLYINRGNENFVGLFGITASSTKSEIKNVVLENPFVKGQDNVGGFAGSTTNTDFSRVAVIDTEQRNRAVGNWMYKDNPIEEITTVGKGIIGRDFVGGIAGEVFTGDISESFSETLMSGNSRVGGLVGSYVSDEYASIPKNKLINSFSNSYIYHVWVTDSNGILGGGLVGETAYTSITNSYFSGFISPQYPYLNFVYTYKNKRAGGLIGTMYSGKIENSFSSAPIISFKTTQTLFNNKRSSGLIAMKTKLTGKSDPIISNIYWGDFFGDDMDQIYFCVGICTNECYLDKTRAKENENCIIVSDSHLVPENPRHSYSYFSATGTTYQSQCNSVILSQIITNTKYYTSKCNSGLDVTNHLNYFMGSNSRDPLNLWNFNIIWKTESSKYPRLKWETGGIPPVTPTTTAECGNAKNTPTSVAPTTN
ncbi:MAG: hypothetical protein Q7R52_02250, partial [archaeon]|nr:hypothetical protein [archaeon]